MRKTTTAALVAMITAAASQSPASAQTGVEAFYKSKDVQLLIGTAPGGTYGLYAQLVTRHLKKHIPGQPNVIMQSMPGAGGNVALNYSYAVAPKDGSLIHVLHAEVLYETLLTSGVKFNARDYNYIGRIADANAVALASKASGVRTFEDAKKREMTMGATGFANVFALGPLMMNRTAGTRFRIIAGYKGTQDIQIAMERGELDGAAFTLANVITIHGEKLKSGEIVPIFAIATERVPEFPSIPAMTEFGDATDKTLMSIYASTATSGRALAFPPGVPADRVAAMRAAFDRMIADADFRADLQKSNVPFAPMSGDDLAKYIAGVMQTPPDQIESARKLQHVLLDGKK